MTIRFTLNGGPVTVDVAADTSLAHLLREDLACTGTKIGCAIGRCGACMVMLDGQAVNSCLVMAFRLQGRSVTTIEGVDQLPLAPLVKQGLAGANAFQCGYCAPGVVMTLTHLFATDPEADEDRIAAALTGNICRCTGYHSILRGALAARALIKAAR